MPASPIVPHARRESLDSARGLRTVPQMGDTRNAWGTRMGTISMRRRADGSIAYRAEVVTRREGKRHKVSATFDREDAATRWIKKKEKEVRAEGYVPPKRREPVTLGGAIERYVREQKNIGRTKAQVLRALLDDPIAAEDCRDVRSEHIVSLAKRLGQDKAPSTVGNYLSHLSAVFTLGEDAWSYELDPAQMQKGIRACQRLGTISKSQRRDRRPTVGEIDRLVAHFRDRTKRTGAMPMDRIIAFAMFSTRRDAEVCRIAWKDYEPEHSRVLVRNMKHPGEKIGNHVWCELPPEAVALIAMQPKTEGAIWPYNPKSVSTAFTRATAILGIDDLRLHDLRHEGVSRLFELGLTIPQVASYSGHRDWKSLQRYSHIRATGDKWAGWLARTFPTP